MVKSLLCVILTAIFLATGAQAQESTPSGGTPSVADAARAKRERQKSTTPKHVITDDDIASKIGPADAADLGASEQEVRAEMEKNYSQTPYEGGHDEADHADAGRRGEWRRGYADVVQAIGAGWV